MQQIVHGLRTRGSMDFDEIGRVVPWIDMAHDLDIDIHAQQAGNLNAFKTHSTLDKLPEGGKYILVLRDPKDTLISHYHFFEDFFFERGSIDIETFAREHYIPKHSVYNHVTALWNHRSNASVLPISFENMKADLEGTVERVAEFIGIELDDELKQIVLKQSNIKFMQEHKDQFEDYLIRQSRSKGMGLPLDGQLNKVRNGQVGESQIALTDEIKKELDDIWSNEISPITGLSSYKELKKELAN